MADEEAQAEETQEQAKKPGLLDNKLVLIGVILLVQAGMAFAAAQFIIKPAAMGGSGEEEVAETEPEEGEERVRGTIVSMEEMVVSLNVRGRTRYLRTTIALEAEDAKVAAAIEERLPGSFLRVHRNALVAARRARELRREADGRLLLVLDGIEETVEVSRRHAAEVRRLMRGDD